MSLKLATKLMIFGAITIIQLTILDYIISSVDIQFYHENGSIIRAVWLVGSLAHYLSILLFFVVLHSKQK